jgi:hypothetical protein
MQGEGSQRDAILEGSVTDGLKGAGERELYLGVIGTLLPGGGATLRTLTSLGGGSDPPSKKFTPLGGGV